MKLKKTDAADAPEPTTGLTSAWGLVRRSWSGYRANFWTYLRVLSIVLVPVNLLGMSSTLSADSGFSAYISVVSVLMNLALIYTVTKLLADRTAAPRLGEAYYEGTASFVRFILVSAVLALVLLPAAIGVVIYLAATTAASGVSVSVGESLLVAAIGLIIAIPSIWLLPRFIFSYYALVKHNLRPIAALKLSRNVTMERYWKVFGRLLVLGVFALIAAIVLAIPSIILALVYHNGLVLSALFQILFGLVMLPVVNLYLARLFGELEQD